MAHSKCFKGSVHLQARVLCKGIYVFYKWGNVNGISDFRISRYIITFR